jgi:rod shape-determining protein MreD
VAAVRGRDAGAVAGFATGLAADVFVATPLGLGALVFTVIGHTLGRTTVSARDPNRRRVARGRAVLAAAGGSLALAATGRVFAAAPPAADTVREAAVGALLALVAGPVALAVVQQRSRR